MNPCKTWCGGTERPPLGHYTRKGKFYCRDRCVRAAVKASRGTPILLNGQPATLGFMSTEYAAGVIANLQAENTRLRSALDEIGGGPFCGVCGSTVKKCDSDPDHCLGWTARAALTPSPRDSGR